MGNRHDAGPPYALEYQHNGKSYAATVGGDSWEEAQAHLRSIGANGRIVGSGVITYRTNALTLPFVAIWVPLIVWFKNLFGDPNDRRR